jgi:excisionase family DNA binding protein
MKAATCPESFRAISEGFESIPRAAAFLGLSRSKLYALMDAGELAFAKFGKARRIPRQALLEYAAKSLVNVTV